MNTDQEVHFVGKIAQKVLLVKNDAVLITRDSRDEVWELPGGRLNLAENPEQGVIREVKEELGVPITINDVVYINQFVHSLDNSAAMVIVYKAQMIDESTQFEVDPVEVAQMEWVNKANWEDYSYYPEYEAALRKYFTQM